MRLQCDMGVPPVILADARRDAHERQKLIPFRSATLRR